MSAWIFEENRVAGFALYQGCDIGVAKWTFEDEEVALPMPEPRSVSNKIRLLRYSVRRGERTISRLSGAEWTKLATRFRQIRECGLETTIRIRRWNSMRHFMLIALRRDWATLSSASP